MIRTLAWMLCGVALTAGAPDAWGQQARYDDVVRNLRNPDAKVRLSALRLLREAGHLEAIEPIAPLVNDPVDEIQLEAIAAELSFYLVEPVPTKRRVALVFEVRSPAQAAAAFEQGPLAAWPRPVPPALVSNLLQAVDDENARVRMEAIYALGVIVRPPLAGEHEEALIKALDHYDPVVRAGAALVAGRLQVSAAGDALIRAVNDSNAGVRYAALRALGEVGEARAVQALGEQLTYYGRGEGAWSALQALARIAHASSVPVFKERVTDREPLLRRAAMEGLGRSGDRSEQTTLQEAAGSDPSEMVRAAAAFALQLQGGNYIPRLVESLRSDRMVQQIGDYLMELGPAVENSLLTHLQDQDPAIRGQVARVLGALGGDASRPALQSLLEDRNRRVVQEATWAIERLDMRTR
ncbi:MAG: HEAT repeat domain-containing protein [Acidobacteria bacterium]|nr:HEAT repeat domain-containing protein [Acidobacteriota bacterium]MBA3885479.1 HEAT repeat domain-containing protein [Acidobacteriota bacterium]